MRASTIRRFLTTLTVATLIGPLSVSPAQGQDQYWHRDLPNFSQSNAQDYAAGWRKLAIDDSFNGGATSSIFAGWAQGSDVNYGKCDSVDSGPCIDPTISFIQGESILPVCSSSVIENCINGLSVASSGSPVSAVFQRSLEGFTFPANAAVQTPAGGTVSLWDSKESPHTGGSTYAVSAQINWFRSGGQTTYRDMTIRVAAVDLRASLDARVTVPYTTESGVPGASRLQSRAANHNPGKNGCFFTQDQVCGYEQEFSPSTRIKVSLKVSNRVTGWLYGRLKDPVISIQDLGMGQNLVEIEAEPVRVAKLHARWNANSLPGVIDDRQGRGAFGDGNLMAGSTDTDAFSIVDKLRTVTQDSATGHKTYWSLASRRDSGGCLSDGARLNGVVTTNAMVFSGGPPVFENGFLNYRVAGMHHGPGGTEVELGTYDVLIRSDVARCLYRFTNAPVSATVAVVGSGGEEKIASTQVSEKDGWLKLAAYGFTFSEKEVRVKLSQVRTLTFTKFSGTSRLLSSKQKFEMWDFGPALANSRSITCTVLHSKPSGRALAGARAKAACDFLRPANPFAIFHWTAKLTTQKSAAGSLLITSK